MNEIKIDVCTKSIFIALWNALESSGGGGVSAEACENMELHKYWQWNCWWKIYEINFHLFFES